MSEQSEHKGVVLGNYRILTRVGSGGMAAVYKAADLTTGQLVALKVLSPPLARHEVFVKRFLEESVHTSRLDHPNVIRIHSIGEQEKKHHFFVMEYAAGGSLALLLRGRRRVSLACAMGYILQAARGLQAALVHGLVHRDVKPSNLLLTKDGAVKVADFGLARDPNGAHVVNGGRKAVGTPAYMSPEQCTLGLVDHRSDIYSLGVTFFHLVTGHQPFRADTPHEVLLKHEWEPTPSPKEFNPHLPPSVCGLILRMMAKLPSQRYQTYEELIADLERVQRETAPNLPAVAVGRGDFLRRRVFAFVLDNAAFLLPSLLLVLAEEGSRFFTSPAGFRVACAVALVALVVYGAIMLAGFGQTLGMKVAGLRLVDAAGRPPGRSVALVRSLAACMFYLVLIFPADVLARFACSLWIVNVAAAFVRRDAQPFHDVLCGTRVKAEAANGTPKLAP